MDLRAVRDRDDTRIFEEVESSVRVYCRQMPAVFCRARNAKVWDEDGNEYVDFLSACGSLNYGHNHPAIKAAVAEYLADDGILNGLDLYTKAKRDFLTDFRQIILNPRRLSYRVQFPGPTGTNAVEAALKLARKVTGRTTIVAFTNAFHGMTPGALAASGNCAARASAGPTLPPVVRLPYDGYHGAGIRELQLFDAMLDDPSSGVELPAAIVLETVQGEGGLNVASGRWLHAVREIADRHGIVFIVDDIQAGCGRCGPFFSFERAGVVPDIVCLSKSLSGIGLPMSLVLIKPEFDAWAPGEHNGTFRGNNLAFIAARAALSLWGDGNFEPETRSKGRRLRSRLEAIVAQLPGDSASVKGIGLMAGIEFADKSVAAQIAEECFKHSVLIETSGPHGEVLKIMPPLTIENEVLDHGLEIVTQCSIGAITTASGCGVGSGSRRGSDSGRGGNGVYRRPPSPPAAIARLASP
ncbi:MAG: diaminobutyrate--2-oxoglutarate transaminase [Alphaproteobacteria bacterium]|nr:diaminobutyrate--2-oxoglutarate transaminase [Alphaproteobacteria bacterium]